MEQIVEMDSHLTDDVHTKIFSNKMFNRDICYISYLFNVEVLCLF